MAAWLPDSFDTKRWRLQQRRGGFVNLINARGPRAVLQLATQRSVLLLRAGRHYFHVAVFAVAYPSGDADQRGFALHKPAEADALYASGDEITTSLELRHERSMGCRYARDKYAPSDVSTRIFSPSLMKGGTYTTSPVSVLAGLVTLLAVADFNPGSVSTTVSSTVCGSSTPTGLPSKNSTLICRLAIR